MRRIRQATIEDIPAVTGIWTAAAGAQFPLDEDLILARTEADPDFTWALCRMAEADGEPAGFCLACRSAQGAPRPRGWATGGWIKLIAVAPAFQRQGLGTLLLHGCEQALLASGPIDTIGAGADPFHFFPGPPDDLAAAQPFLRNRGYAVGEDGPWDMMRDIGDFEVPDSVESLLAELAPGVRIVKATREHKPAICRFLHREFPGGWHYYSRLYLAGDGDPGNFVILLDGECVEGFCRIAHYGSPHVLGNTLWRMALGERYGGLGPIGVSAHVRGRGLGLALLCKSVEYLREAGVRNMCIDWTGLVDFYGKIGFERWKHYRHARRRVV